MDVVEASAGQDERCFVGITDGAAKDGGIEDAGAVARAAVYVAEAGRVRADEQGERGSRLEERGSGYLPAAPDLPRPVERQPVGRIEVAEPFAVAQRIVLGLAAEIEQVFV